MTPYKQTIKHSILAMMAGLENSKPLNTVLFGVLNWGLGHASRSGLLIRFFLSKGIKVEIASDGIALAYLKKEFPDLTFHALKGYNILYASNKNWLPLKLLSQLPKLRSAIRSEEKKVSELISERSYDLIISDNRYGFRAKTVKSILLCHQLNIVTPKMFNWVNNAQVSLQNGFDAILVPDFKSLETSLSGNLSRPQIEYKNHHFIGPISPFSRSKLDHSNKDIDILIVLSGPEPQRTLLEKKLITLATNRKEKIVLVRGTEQPMTNGPNFKTFNLLQHEELAKLFERSRLIVTRSGYSTLMDLYYVGLPSILIPTPGQTEQEYLAKLHRERPNYFVIHQDELSTSIFKRFEAMKKHAPNQTNNYSAEKAFEYALSEEGFTMPT